MTNLEYLYNERSTALIASEKTLHIYLTDEDINEIAFAAGLRQNWLLQKHKQPFEISLAEKLILENIDTKYKWLVKNKDCKVYVHKSKPNRDIDVWISDGDSFSLSHFTKLFKFLKWEDDPVYILAVLNNCEVIE